MRPTALALATAFLAVLAGATLAAAPAAATGTAKTIYSFCKLQNCTDGSEPNGLVEDANRNLYGTVYKGGAYGFGGIFELRWKRTHYGAEERMLYSFCAQQNCTDGGYPTGGLIVDTKGNLYGTALIGGSQGNGEVFELVRNHRRDWSLKILYGFCPEAQDCTDGVGPDSGLAYAGEQAGNPYDGRSPLYGTTDGGGITNIWRGVAYRIAPSNGGWNFQVIYSFCAQANCADGAYPFATLTEDASGNLYGTALEGGNATGSGAVFELTPSNGSFSESVLYDFCSLANCSDGAYPHGGLVLDSAGRLDGATLEGGAACSIDTAGCGVSYTLSSGDNGWSESVTHTFCNKAGCGSGANPQGEPATDGSGNVFAIAEDGGAARHRAGGSGTLYELSGGHFRLLHKFCVAKTCHGGANPLNGPILDAAGDLFGTASTGGRYGGGVVYEYVP